MAFSENQIDRPYWPRCEYLIDPIGIDVMVPRLSWILSHSGRGVRQSAYQIQVASRLERLLKDEGDVWDSGKVASHAPVNVSVGGVPLSSRQRCFWRVRWWDSEDRISEYSDVATFETGLGTGEWNARWIEGRSLFRRKIRVREEVESTRVYVSGLGFYELYVNGNRVGDQVLDPAWTSYDKVILYSTYDVTKLVVDGENAIGVFLGSAGMHRSRDLTSPPYITKFIELYGQSNRKLILQFMIRYVDGGEEVFVSDDTWKTEYGPVVEDDLCDGETYDARLERSGWCEPGYDDSKWSGASLAAPPGGELASQATLQPIRRVDFLKPLNLSNPKPGLYTYDFGQNFAGWVKLRVQGPRGTQVKLRFSELLSPDGTLNTKPNRSARAEDVYILKGGGVEIYEPRFTYNGFKYVEVSGYPGTPGLDSVEGVVVNSDVRTIGGFSCARAP
jgi:alpha-L-rhamnosidase